MWKLQRHHIVTLKLSGFYRIILRDRMEKKYSGKKSEKQSGFRTGRSCINNILCTKQMIEKRTAVNQEIHLLFVNLAKAYDVSISKLWKY